MKPEEQVRADSAISERNKPNKPRNRVPHKSIDPRYWQECFSYLGDGTIVRKARPKSHFSSEAAWKTWNKRYSGKPVNSLVGKYLKVEVLAIARPVHLIVWALHHGKWPDLQVDHINGNRLDNRIENLRLATHSQNLWNVGAHAQNKSGIKGIYQRKNRWVAMIRANNERYHLGSFRTAEDARAAYCAAADRLHGEFANHG